MNESILQALMRLFALVAYVNEKGQASIERGVVYDYLYRQFSSELTENYLQVFDAYLHEYHPDLTVVSEDRREEQDLINSKAVKELCNELNLELEQEQKIFIIVYLLDFISSGGQISSYQFRFIEEVVSYLNVSYEEYTDAKHFTFNEIDQVKRKENLLFVNSYHQNDNKKSKHLYIDKLEGVVMVLLMPSTNTYILRYRGTQVLLLNGHNIKSNRSYIWAHGSVIKNPIFGSIYHTWIAGKFIKDSPQRQFVFIADNIEFSYGNSPNGLKRFNLNEESGRLIGIIGGSGSGKSTLLKVLAGVIKPNHGSIKINGYDIYNNAELLKGVIGYVPQDDFLIKELTVFENLYFNAKFSFSNYSEEKINNVVERALLDFDLVEARDLQVGDSLSTFLSGGQRKRLNIALELLREPSVLFIDEPTSGLSSMDSEKVMNLLKRQTIKGKLVFANIHQPSSELFKLLDKLLVVDQGGRVVWYGNPLDAISYFKEMNHYVDAGTSECLSCGNINSDHILRNIEARVVDVNGRLTRKRKTSPQEWYEHYIGRIDPIIKSIRRPHLSKVPENYFNIPSRWEQIKLYFKRDLFAKVKNSQYLLVTMLEAPVLAVMLAFYMRSSRDLRGNITSYVFGLNHNIPAYLFMIVIVSLFLGLVISAEEIFRDRRLLERERFLNLSRAGYLLSKTSMMFLISAIQMLVLVIVGNYILEIKGMAWRYFIVLFSSACWANMVGLNISSGFKSVVTIYVLVPVILVPQLLFSGVVVNFHDLNKSIQSFKYVPMVGDMMTSRWAYESIVVTQFKDNPYEKNFFHNELKKSEALYIKAFLIPELLEKLEFVNENINNRKKIAEVTSGIRLLRNEIKKLHLKNPKEQLQFLKQLNIQYFDALTYDKAKQYFGLIYSNYHNQYLTTLNENDGKYMQITENMGGREEFIKFKNKYYNNQLASLVQNRDEINPFFIHNGNIIKLKDPIFTNPVSRDGRAHFYAPQKRIGNLYFDTFWYNIIIIWMSTLLWFVILYFDVLFRLIKYFDNIRLRRFNRQIARILGRQYDPK